MQVYEIAYGPRKGSSAAHTFEYLPLIEDKRSLALRALHPDRRIISVRPHDPPIRDKGEYTYWWISFHYRGPFINIPTDSDADREASKNLFNAERCVDYALTKLGVQHQHAYSWPDGSLFYFIRTLDTDISKLVQLINLEMELLATRPITLRYSLTYNKKRRHLRAVFGALSVQVSRFGRIESPWEEDPMKVDCLNYVDYFERAPFWRKDKEKSAEDPKNPAHKAFRAGFEEAFGHQRLFHYSVHPTEFALAAGATPAGEEACIVYTGAYVLGKVLLTLLIPDGAAQKPWRLLHDEPEKADADEVPEVDEP